MVPGPKPAVECPGLHLNRWHNWLLVPEGRLEENRGAMGVCLDPRAAPPLLHQFSDPAPAVHYLLRFQDHGRRRLE